MIKSRFVQDILFLLIDGYKQESELNKQIQFLSDTDYAYTGSGLIVSFVKEKSICEYKIDDNEVLNGVTIESSELEFGATTNLFFEDGVILYLEIFSNSSTYPEKPLSDYRLLQAWLPAGGKIIEYPDKR